MSATKVKSTSGALHKTSKKHKLVDNTDSSPKKRRVETGRSAAREATNAEDGEENNVHSSRRSSTLVGDSKDSVLNGNVG